MAKVVGKRSSNLCLNGRVLLESKESFGVLKDVALGWMEVRRSVILNA